MAGARQLAEIVTGLPDRGGGALPGVTANALRPVHPAVHPVQHTATTTANRSPTTSAPPRVHVSAVLWCCTARARGDADGDRTMISNAASVVMACTAGYTVPFIERAVLGQVADELLRWSRDPVHPVGPGVYLVSLNDSTAHFAEFGPIPAMQLIPDLIADGTIPKAMMASGYRWFRASIAIAIGVPLGILIGSSRRFRELSNSPFQLMRMISPLSWGPCGHRVCNLEPGDHLPDRHRIDLAGGIFHCRGPGQGGSGVVQGGSQSRRQAVAHGREDHRAGDYLRCPDGIRLALGVAWIVLVPAEFLGVTSGLGYSIQDARETLSYDYLMAMVLVIGAMAMSLTVPASGSSNDSVGIGDV